ncbi:MAG: hypothetical protein KJ995_07935 [Candidatus Omnitrophica bacterium]|nr:hypothetical protein [Candidatus Omnitrophota bacterium]
MKRLIAVDADKREMVPALAAAWFKVCGPRNETVFIEVDKDGWQERAGEIIPLLCKSVEAGSFQALTIPDDLVAALLRSGIECVIDSTIIGGSSFTMPIEDAAKIQYGIPFQFEAVTQTYDMEGLRGLWTEHVAPKLATGGDVVVSPAFSGVYIQIHWEREPGVFEVFDASGRNRKTDFPGLNEVLTRLRCEDCIIEAIATIRKDGWVHPVQSFWYGDTRVGGSAKCILNVTDALMVDGRSIAGERTMERIVSVYRMFMDSSAGFVGEDYTLRPIPAKVIRQGATLDDFVDAAHELPSVGGSEALPPITGVVMRDCAATRAGEDRTLVWANLNRFEFEAEVIGVKKVPENPFPSEHWSTETAREMFDYSVKTGRFLDLCLAVPISDNDPRLTPLCSGATLKPIDFERGWDEDLQCWTGLWDSRDWKFADGFKSETTLNAMAVLRVPRCFRDMELGNRICVAIHDIIPMEGVGGHVIMAGVGMEYQPGLASEGTPDTADTILAAQGIDPTPYDFVGKERKRRRPWRR